MARVLILGATGMLGRYVVRAAVSAGHEITALVRARSRVPDHIRTRITVREADLAIMPVGVLAAYAQQHDIVINTAGRVTDGQRFVDLTARIVTTLELLPPEERPVAWFMAGAALLDLDQRGRRGVDLPRVEKTFWPHAANYDRLCRSPLDWRLLCPGPLVHQPALGLDRLRLSLDRTPVRVPQWTSVLPGALAMPFFGYRVPEMIIPYADAAAVIMAHLGRASQTSRHRVGVALPRGMRGRKDQWVAARGAA